MKLTQVERIEVGKDTTEVVNTLNNSAMFGNSVAHPSTKRGALESELGNSRELDPSVRKSNLAIGPIN